MAALSAVILAMLLTLPFEQKYVYAESFSFHNQTKYVDESKILHIYGEIKNESNRAMKDIVITASFKDSNGAQLLQYQQTPKLRVLNPGDSAPFDIIYLDSATADKVASFALSAIGKETSSKPDSMKILSSNSRLDLLGLFYINVSVRNNGTQTASNPIVIATLYDKDGKVIALGEALAEGGDRIVDMAPGQKAGFGVVISDRTQTYKAIGYSLVVDSDQYISDQVQYKTAGIGANSGTGSGSSGSGPTNGGKSGCLIATAAFESELAPQVQKLRIFRDNLALKTMAGSSFMNVFNDWYYSFSPQVANFERNQGWLRSIVRTSIYPLLGILDLSTIVFQNLSFNGEAAIVGAGLTASSLIGLLYFAPLTVGIAFIARKNRWDMRYAKFVLMMTWGSSIAALGIGEMISSTGVLMFGTALLVLSVISTIIIGIARTISLLKCKRSKETPSSVSP